MRRFIVTMIVFVMAAFAADISGNWKGTAEGPQGNLERSFVFKVDGTKLTGETTSEMLGKSTIADGKVDGDTISFSITASMGGQRTEAELQGQSDRKRNPTDQRDARRPGRPADHLASEEAVGRYPTRRLQTATRVVPIRIRAAVSPTQMPTTPRRSG